MSSAIFVHGISIREQDYQQSFAQIQTRLKQHGSNLKLEPCLWGEHYGAALKAGGASIPQYSMTKGLEETALADDTEQWQALYADPLLELRLLALRGGAEEAFDPLGRKTPSQLLDQRVQALASAAGLTDVLERAGVSRQELQLALQAIVGSSAYAEALRASADNLADFRQALARAVVAKLVEQTQVSASRSTLLGDAAARDALMQRLANELGGQEKGFLDSWLKKALSAMGTRYMMSWRGYYSSVFVPYIGDTLAYQGVGQAIRDMIRTRVRNNEPPAVLLGHSLGGVACVDLLVAEAVPEVKLLITVGSQAPLFYELDVLRNLRYGEKLPDHFPRWLNIYDKRDFLSYIGAKVFGDPYDRIEDVEVDNRQPFPWSHSAYWSNEDMWQAILARLPGNTA